MVQSLIGQAAAVLPAVAPGEPSEASSYTAERNRLTRSLGRSEFRDSLVDEAARTVPGFQPRADGERLDRMQKFQPGSGVLRTTGIEIGGAPAMTGAAPPGCSATCETRPTCHNWA